MEGVCTLEGTTVDITGMPGGTEGNRDMLQDFRDSDRVLNRAAPNRKHDC